MNRNRFAYSQLFVAIAFGFSMRVAQGDGAFVLNAEYDPTGIVHHYVLTNHDGTRPEYISTWYASRTQVQAFKFHYGESPAALVSAEMDLRTFSLGRITSLKIVPGQSPVTMATLDVDRRGGHLVSGLPLLGIRGARDPLPENPFCVYPFDLITLSMMMPHLKSPEKGFSVDIVDANRGGVGGRVMLNLGKIKCTHTGIVQRDGHRVHAYRVDGLERHRLDGRIWTDVENGHVVEILIDRPTNPDWSTFRLKLLRSNRFTTDEWAKFRTTVLARQPKPTDRDKGWQADIDLLMTTLSENHVNPSHTRPYVEILASARDVRHQVPRLTDPVLAAEIQRILAMIGDGHTLSFVGFGMGSEQNRLPVRLHQFSDGLFIVAADRENRQLVGSRIVRIGAYRVTEAISALEPYVSRDNASGSRLLTDLYLTTPKFLVASGISKSQLEIELTLANAAGDKTTVKLRPKPFLLDDARRVFDPPQGWSVLGGDVTPKYLSSLNREFWFEELTDMDCVYCQINELRDRGDELLDAFAKRMLGYTSARSIRHLILDLRLNRGGDNTRAECLVDLLANDQNLNRKGRLFVIIGRRTFSAAQNLATKLDIETKAVFVGEPSGSRPNHYGETNLAILPYSRISYSVSSIYWQDSSPSDDRPWIAPSIKVAETSSDRAQGRDPALDAVLQRIVDAKSHSVPEPSGQPE